MKEESVIPAAPGAPRKWPLRAETGVVQFQGDWPGVFIRGDDAFRLSVRLTLYLQKHPYASRRETAVLTELAQFLESCDARKNPKCQLARILDSEALPAQPDKP